MPGGMIVGTCSEPQPTPGFSETTNIDVARAFATSPYTGYMMTDTLVASLFSGVPVGANSWRWTSCTSSIRWLMGSDLNGTDGGDPDDPIVILEICENIATLFKDVYIGIDDISIVIY